MKKIKVISIMLSAVLLLSSCTSGESGASEQAENVVAQIGDVSIPVGVYINGLQQGYDTILMAHENPSEEIRNEEIDGVPVTDIVEQTAREYLLEHIGVELLYNELGLTLAEEHIVGITDYVDYEWEEYGAKDIFEPYGIDKTSYTFILTNYQKSLEIFEHYYSEGGEFAPDRGVLEDILKNDYLHVNALYFYQGGIEGVVPEISSDNVKSTAERFLARLQNGEDFTGLYEEVAQLYGEVLDPVSDDEENPYSSLSLRQDIGEPGGELHDMIVDAEYNEVFMYEDEYTLTVMQKLDPVTEKNIENEGIFILQGLYFEEFRDMLIEKTEQEPEAFTINEEALQEYNATDMEIMYLEFAI